MNAAGFWSYSHDDDERDGHGLLRLASRIQDEFALVTGETLTLFVDRDAISWGDEWRRRIETALAETTFFIPIITPLYFKRQECRRELLSFVGQAQSLDAIELVMPILYVDVADLAEDSSDEARALVARMQHTDWRELRLSDENSSEYRRAVHKLALRLAEISNEYQQSDSQTSFNDDVSQQEVEQEEEGLFDLLATIEQKLAQWQEYIDDAKGLDAQLTAIYRSYTARLRKIEMRGTTGPLLALVRSLVREVEPLERRSLEDAKNYSTVSIELDPEILKLLRELDIYPEASARVFGTLAPIEGAFKEVIDHRGKPSRSRHVLQRYKGLSKDIARILRLHEAYLRYLEDGNSLVLNWNQTVQGYKERINGE
jgi:hypothetical protein